MAFTKIRYESKTLTRIKFKAPWFSKFSRGTPIHLCQGCTSPAPYPTRLLLSRQDYVLQLLYNFLLPLSFNLKTLTLLGKQEPNHKNTRHISRKKKFCTLKFGTFYFQILFNSFWKNFTQSNISNTSFKCTNFKKVNLYQQIKN